MWESIPPEFLSVIDYKKFFPGSFDESPESPNINSRCYLNFKSFTIAKEFMMKFHGHIFKSSSGEIFRAVVAIAPFQRVPRSWKQLRNAFENQIEEDTHYKQFLIEQQTAADLPPAPYSFEKEKSESFVSPLVKSLAEQNQRMNQLLRNKREEKFVKHVNPAPVKPEDSLPHLSLKAPPKPRAAKEKKPKPAAAPTTAAPKLITRPAGIPMIITRPSDEKSAAPEDGPVEKKVQPVTTKGKGTSTESGKGARGKGKGEGIAPSTQKIDS